MKSNNVLPEEAVLREMMFLARSRRAEEMSMIDKVNSYNLALIAFSGSFLSLLITADLPLLLVKWSGVFLVLSIVISLITIAPWKVKAAIEIEEDIQLIHSGHGSEMHLKQYLLDCSIVTNLAANNATKLVQKKKISTIVSASMLAIALCITYSIYVYA